MNDDPGADEARCDHVVGDAEPGLEGGEEKAWLDAGDPVCWLDQVCERCGNLVEPPTADRCPACGAGRDR